MPSPEPPFVGGFPSPNGPANRPAPSAVVAATGRPAMPGTVTTPPPVSTVRPTLVAPPRAVARPIPVAASKGPRKLDLRETPESEDHDLAQRALKRSPPWLISMTVHMLLIIILGLWATANQRSAESIELAVFNDQLGEQLENEMISLSNDSESETENIITPSNLSEVEDPFATPPKLDIELEGTEGSVDLSGPVIGLALKGREAGMKDALLRKFGGNKETEEAVRLGLAWLAKQQRKDGTWSLQGPYTSGIARGQSDNPESATAMALLAFLGNNQTDRTGEYKKQVTAGFNALVRSQDADGGFFKSGTNNARLYTQAQCTIAVCELYGMTKDTNYRHVAELAVKFCVEAQDPELGGWRYEPRFDSDTSVTGWMVMALQSARMAGFDVPSTTLSKVGEFLDLVSEGGSRYAYQVGVVPNEVMTAEALLCRQYLGWSRDDPRLLEGVKFVMQFPPRWEDRNLYYWYYGTQVMHHMEGEYWREWNTAFRDMLVEHQERKGREVGSWDPLGKHPDVWSARGYGGRLYVTCLSIYMLEVYYRHLPIYMELRR